MSTAQMSGRERIMAILTGKPYDRIPWAPLIDAYYTTSLPELGLPEMDVIDTLRYAGADIILRHVPCIQEHFTDKVERSVSTNGDLTVTKLSTPVGEITTVHRARGKTSFKIKPYVESIEDLKVLQYVRENTYYTECFDKFHEVSERIGDDGIATASTPMSPIQMLLQSYIGVENFTYMLYDYEDEVREYMEVDHAKNMEQYRLLASAPEEIKVFIDYEDTSTTVMSPSWFRDYSAPCINEYSDISHSTGKIFIAHMCGKLYGLLDELSELHVDGFDSVCPATTGDLDAAVALERLPGKLVIGGIEPPSLKMMSTEQCVQTAAKVIQDCKPYGRFILCTGDATPYGTPMENLQALSKLVEEIG